MAHEIKFGHVPLCAQHAAERYAEFPKQERMNSLRPYLAKYDLFPPRRDPQTAPIRMEQLKGLVRKWKLHHQRNFWRNHPSTEDVVNACQKYLKEKRRLEQQKKEIQAKRRNEQGLGVSFASKKPPPSPNEVKQEHPSSPKGGPIKLFGAHYIEKSNEQMIYESRGVAHGDFRDFLTPAEASSVVDKIMAEEEEELDELEGMNDEERMLSRGGKRGSVGGEDESKLVTKRKVSNALLNFTLNEQIRKQFLEEGGLEALLLLSASTVDPETTGNCAACFVNLVADPDYRPMDLIQAGCVPVLLKLATLDVTERVSHCCSLVLGSLSVHDKPDIEEYLIGDGAVTAATHMVLRCTNPHTRELAAKSMINLSRFIESPTQVESLNNNVMQCIRALSQYDESGHLQFSAAALEDLSCIQAARPILASAGAIQIIKQLMHGSNSNTIISSCSVALCNMALLKSCQKEMVQLGVIEVLGAMLLRGTDHTKLMCTVCLANLSTYKELRQSIETRGGPQILFNFVKVCRMEESLKVCGRVFFNFAHDSQTRACLVRKDPEGNGIDALTTLLRFDGPPPRRLDQEEPENAPSPDPIVVGRLRESLCALCCLTADDDTVKAVVANEDTLKALVPIQDLKDLYPYLSVLLHNLSLYDPALRPMTTNDSILVLLKMCEAEDTMVQQNVLATLHMLAADTNTHPVLFDNDIISSLSDLCGGQKEIGVVHLAALIIQRLSCYEENSTRLLDMGAISLMVSVVNNWPKAKPTLSCIASSYYNMCQTKAITEIGFLDTLISLSDSLENERVLWSASAFSCASCFPRGRTMLGNSRWVIPCLSTMMRSGCTDAEKIQKHCAITLCNSLSVHLKKRDVLAMIEEGTVQDLIVITVLRVNDVNTKQVLAKALFNLLARADTRPELTEQDLPYSFIRLTKMDDRELNMLCVKVLLNYSAEVETYVEKLKEMNAVRVLTEQVRSKAGGVDFKRMTGMALSNMSFHEGLSPMLAEVRDGQVPIVESIKAIAAIEEEETYENCARVLYNLAAQDLCRANLAQGDVVSVAVSLANSGNGTTRQLCVATLCFLSCEPTAFVALTENGSLKLLCEAIKSPTMQVATRMNAARTVANLVVYHPPSRHPCIMCGMTIACTILLKSLSDEDDEAVLAKIFRDMSRDTEGVFHMLDEGAMTALLKLSKLEEAQLKHDVATCLANLTACKYASAVVEEGAIEACFWLVLQDCLGLTTAIFREVSIVIRQLTQHNVLGPQAAVEEKTLAVLIKLANFEDNAVMTNTAVSFYHVFGYEKARRPMVRKGAVETLIKLANAKAGGPIVRDVCSATLHQVPNQDLVGMDAQMLKVLMALLHMQDASMLDPDSFLPDRSKASKGAWDLTVPTEVHSRTEYKLIPAQWPTMIVDRKTTTFLPSRYESPVASPQKLDPENIGDGNKAQQVGSFKKLKVTVSMVNQQTLAQPIEGDPSNGDGETGVPLEPDSAASVEAADRMGGNLDTLEEGGATDASDAMNMILPPLGALAPPLSSPVPPSMGMAKGGVFGPGLGERRDDRLEDINGYSKPGDLRPASAIAVQRDSLRDAFQSSTSAVPRLMRPQSEGDMLRADMASQCPGGGGGGGTGTKKRTKGRPRKKSKDVQAFLVAQQQRQQDRIADDYAAMLYQARSPAR